MNKAQKALNVLKQIPIFTNNGYVVGISRYKPKEVEQLQELTSIEFNWSEVAHLQYFIKRLKYKKPHEVLEWDQLELLEKLTSVAEKLEQTHGGTQQDKIFAQRVFCESHGFKEVAPLNGYCPSCRVDIYFKMTVEEAGSHRVTQCPHCHYQFINEREA